MSIPQPFIQELLARTDVVEVVGRYVQLKKAGANYMGLCPFHGEKSPSFSVSPSKQFYHCFGCGANGNAIGFLMEHAGMGFVEAVKDLAQQTGLAVPEENASPQDRARAQAQREQQQSLTELLDLASRVYQKQLKTAPRAVAYLKGRGLSGQVAKTFGLGYAPAGWRPLAGLLPDYADPRLVESGLVIASEDAHPGDTTAPGDAPSRESKRYDRFRDRIMFPIRNVKGETIGFGGRVLDKGEPKYLNSPETPVFSKGHELYGLFEARTAIRTQGYALVTEGYMDVVALAQLGFANAVATLGTACTAEHVHKLFRFTDAVIFSFDGDAAGRRAAAKALVAALPYAQDTRSVKFLFLPPEHDPDSYIREHGQDAFAECVRTAVPLSRFLLETAASHCDLDTAEGRSLLASQARPLWSALPEGALRRQMLGELAQRVGLAPAELSDLWNAPAPSPRKSSENKSTEFNKQERQRPFSSEKRSNWQSRPRTGNWRTASERQLDHGPAPTGRAEHVARLVLSHPQAWDWLTAEDHQLLAHQPPPVGPLFSWLEAQWHEHGAQPWAVLQQALEAQPFAPLANRLMTQALALAPRPAAESPESEHTQDADARRELRELLRRMLIDDLMVRETAALEQAQTHPEALRTYRELYERRCALQKEMAAPPV